MRNCDASEIAHITHASSVLGVNVGHKTTDGDRVLNDGKKGTGR